MTVIVWPYGPEGWGSSRYELDSMDADGFTLSGPFLDVGLASLTPQILVERAWLAFCSDMTGGPQFEGFVPSIVILWG